MNETVVKLEPITPKQAKQFTEELDTLMKKYDFAFPCMITVFRRLPHDITLEANTELLERFPNTERYNSSFTVHNGSDDDE
jgi:hypothetical protein